MAFALLSFVFASLLLEGGARLIASARNIPIERLQPDWNNTLYVPHAQLGYALRPGYIREDYQDGTLRINSLGLRGPEIQQAKPPGTIRIVCLGGSTTFSIKVGDATTYPRLLEGRLRARYPGVAIEVINAGVGAYTSAESVVNMALRVIDLAPDVVIVYHAVNDVHPRIFAGFRSDYSHYRRPFALPSNDALLERVRRSSVAVAMLHDVLSSRPTYLSLSHMTMHQLFEDTPLDAQWNNFSTTTSDAFRRNIETITALAQAHGALVVLSTFTYSQEELRASSRLDARTYSEGIAQHNAVMRDICASFECTLVEMATEFPHHQSDLFNDFVHLNARGTAIKAELFERALVRDRVIPRLLANRVLEP